MVDIDINKTAVCGLIRCFAHEVLSRQKSYQNDLLISYLQFIISLRSECIDYSFANYILSIQLFQDIRHVEFRILKYFDSFGKRVNHSPIGNTSNYLIKETVAWDNGNHITFNVPFDDLKSIIHLVDLTLHSSDRQTKITACELLQSIMVYIIGKRVNN
ncbi:unnamed protein product [Rotaria sp. Silwood2]|nr:unnamed protein product [Rotaria sp. Silwood2]CAF3039077.1 unnamed protein product [Rotaria sp. Silwood2]CAF3197870.1 unnamed protein product [Rotaria sp. Silwood2]CAF3421442.1 unnamed protein product [Rotaria sp. Silwood2]CAF4068292.1 unnamed protein product [Rotaria sp. Silwood2]